MSINSARKAIKQSELITKIETVIKPEFVDEWLKRPLPAFGNRTAEDIIDSGEEDKIEEMIYWLGSGALS